MLRYFSHGQLTMKWLSKDPDPGVSDPVARWLTMILHCLVVGRRATKNGPLPSAHQCPNYYLPSSQGGRLRVRNVEWPAHIISKWPKLEMRISLKVKPVFLDIHELPFWGTSWLSERALVANLCVGWMFAFLTQGDVGINGLLQSTAFGTWRTGCISLSRGAVFVATFAILKYFEKADPNEKDMCSHSSKCTELVIGAQHSARHRWRRRDWFSVSWSLCCCRENRHEWWRTSSGSRESTTGVADRAGEVQESYGEKMTLNFGLNDES